MKLEQNLLCVHLNEFNYEYLQKGAKKYKCKNIEKLLKLKKIHTFTNDKQQNKNQCDKCYPLYRIHFHCASS